MNAIKYDNGNIDVESIIKFYRQLTLHNIYKYFIILLEMDIMHKSTFYFI